MVELRQGRILTPLSVLFISCSVFVESDDNTTVEPCTEKCNYDVIRILLFVTAGILIVLFAGLIIYCIRRYLRRATYDSFPSHTFGHLTKGRISNVELWKLVEYSDKIKENDKLSEAIRQLTPGTHGISTPGNGTCSTDYDRKLKDFQRLCSWKKTCTDTEQMDKLFEACWQARMEETVRKLRDFRYDVSEGVSEYDLKHILWQIGKTSSENITTLLDRLTKSSFNKESSVPRNVHRAFPELHEWTKGNHAINPTVMLSLQSDDLCDEDMYFCTVSEGEKRPLEKAEIKQHVRDVSTAHCQKIISIISTKCKYKRYKEEKVINTIINENETDLFNTYQMIEEWFDEQECSNYDKRMRLQNAVDGAQKASTSNEICLGEIDTLASSKGNAKAAYELLMKDIKPFATKLRLDESKLTKYKQLSISSVSHSGTIGLVADVRSRTGKK